MVLVDSNVFILDRFFPHDDLYEQNKAFVAQFASLEVGISAFTLLELSGAASFRLPIRELESWVVRFTTVYPVYVIDTFGLVGKATTDWWSAFVGEVSENVCKKMTLGDALLLREAENYAVEALVTWNNKDFARRAQLPVLTPTMFLRQWQRSRR